MYEAMHTSMTNDVKNTMRLEVCKKMELPCKMFLTRSFRIHAFHIALNQFHGKCF